MERISRYCTNCGSELDEGAKFCAQCGSPTRQHDAPVAANESKGQPRKDNAPDVADEGSRQPRQDDAPAAAGVAGRQPRKDVAAVAVGEAWSGYRRFLRIDPSGGFFAIVTPLFIWTAAAGILTWAVLGLVSLRFDLSILNLEDLFFTMLIIIGIMLSVVANAYLVLSYRDRTGALGQVLRQLPMVWAAGLCVGLFIMIWQVWTDFAGGPNELRRAMFSLIGIGVCGTYGGYLSLVAIGPDRIYQVVRRVVYVLIAVIAVEVLDALWWGTRHLSGAEIGTHFVRAGWTAFSCVAVYSIIAFFMAQARAKKLQISMLVAYLVLGLFGFTIAVGALWDTFPPGAIRFVHGAIVIVTVATIGLLMVQHFHRKRDTGNPQSDSAGVVGQPSTTTAL